MYVKCPLLLAVENFRGLITTSRSVYRIVEKGTFVVDIRQRFDKHNI
jgi:hypothetical protein